MVKIKPKSSDYFFFNTNNKRKIINQIPRNSSHYYFKRKIKLIKREGWFKVGKRFFLNIQVALDSNSNLMYRF